VNPSRALVTVLTASFVAAFVAPGVARAEEPMPPEETASADVPVTEPEAAPDAAPEEPAPEPAPARAKRDRVSMSTSRTRVVDDGQGRLEKTEDTVLGGQHWRIKTAQGAVHVWVPPGYDRATAGTVVYVHGYYTNSDGAWRDHALAKQFKASRQNAMFIVPDAPAGNEQQVRWPALPALRRAVTRANIRLPDGPTIVMGHSGAFRTVMQWVDHRHVAQIILLDAMYAGEKKFDEFVSSGKRAENHKLIVVAASTAEGSASFAKKYKFAVTRERVPASIDELSKRERRARLLYIRSQYDHMSIVTSHKVIPVLLRVTPLAAL